MPELICDLCERDYPVWFAPSSLWNAICRLEDGSDRWPFLCLDCFALKAEEAGIKPTAWMLIEEPWDETLRKAHSLP